MMPLLEYFFIISIVIVYILSQLLPNSKLMRLAQQSLGSHFTNTKSMVL